MLGAQECNEVATDSISIISVLLSVDLRYATLDPPIFSIGSMISSDVLEEEVVNASPKPCTFKYERLFKCAPYIFIYTVHVSIRHISDRVYRVRICYAYLCA